MREKPFTEDDTITFDRAYKLPVSTEAAESNATMVGIKPLTVCQCVRRRLGASAETSEQAANSGGRRRRTRAGAGSPAVQVPLTERVAVSSGVPGDRNVKRVETKMSSKHENLKYIYEKGTWRECVLN